MCPCEWVFDKKNFFFLKFYERRDKYRYLIKKGACGENKITRDLSSLPNVDAQNALSDLIRTCSKEKENFKLDLRTYNEESFDVTIPFKKRTEVLINSFQYYEQQQENKKQ